MSSWVATALVWLALSAWLGLGLGTALLGAALALAFGGVSRRWPLHSSRPDREADEQAEDWLLLDE